MEHYRVGSNEDPPAPLSVLSSSVEQQTYVAHGWTRPVSDQTTQAPKSFPSSTSISKAGFKLASDRFPVRKTAGSDAGHVWVVRTNTGR